MAKKKVKGVSVLRYSLLGAGLILTFIAPGLPGLVERGYSRTIYRWVSVPISRLTGIFPFSVAEFSLVLAGLFGLYQIIKLAVVLVRKPRTVPAKILKGLGRAAVAAIWLYVSFYMLWGLNYSRLSFAEISGLSVTPSSTEELAALARTLTERANVLRLEVAEDEGGVMTLAGGIRQMLARADAGYREGALVYPLLGGSYGRPKAVLLSHYWSYTGISGMYFPFTGEANVNTDMPHLMLPATAAHEMAHQRGFAREDEANYLAYFTCSLHPDADFQYSGTVLALIHVMNALYGADTQAYKQVHSLYSPGLVRDLKNWRDYWQGFAGPVEKMSSSVNDSFLRANGQEDGLASYGRMIDLLLAQYRRDSLVKP